MTNPFDYLFYKLVKFMSHMVFSLPERHAIPVMWLLLSANVLTILNFVLGKFLPPIVIIAIVILIYVLVLVIYSSKRYVKIAGRYENESDNHRIRGNLIVILYVVLSILLMVWSFRLLPVDN